MKLNKKSISVFAICLIGLIFLAGCQRPQEIKYASSKEVNELEPQLQAAVAKAIQHECGTPSRPKLLGNPDIAVERLLNGQAVFEKRCASCHGSTGDGNGPVASMMYPRPRDYRRGVFKFTSTKNNQRPLRSDIVGTVKRGAVGTSMPSFSQLSNQDLNDVVDYVLVLTHRGELESFLAQEAEDNTIPLPKEEGGNPDAEEKSRLLKLDPEFVESKKSLILNVWNDAKNQVVIPFSTEIPFSLESVALGKQAFLTDQAGCFKCHGSDGRGVPITSGEKSQFKDAWGFETRAADLSAGMFHGGNQSIDIYRRIIAGVSGTPMPAHESIFRDQPEVIWHVVHYVQYISSARRRDVLADSVFDDSAKQKQAKSTPQK